METLFTFTELLLHYLKSLKDEFKINQDELACEREQQCFFATNNTLRLINMLIQI